ncbi:XRE family transcriptional regulator [Acinetobacter baumannii]|uniref:XRE family transcriptional regulator n=1 Tax=Acinetobacter baumannii TaxID=470 RepID=UPI001072989C|nr:XRE family transcriptional regulator [Acinetobacter baumannii]QBR76281.1 XRE family transcriptional regulator [Acinetobacter baumannii]
MERNLEQYRTPGQALSALLIEKGWNGRVLAGILQIDESGVNRLLQDKKSISPNLAIIFEDIFKVPAEQFINLQGQYDLAKARLKVMPDPQLEYRAKLFGSLPIADMINRSWLNVENKKDFNKIESELLRLFKVDSLEKIIEITPHSAKKSNCDDIATPVQLAWINHVKRIASEMIVPAYSPEKGKMAAEKLKPLLYSAEEIRKVPRILMEHGIRFVIVESLKGSKMDGVCLWLNDGASPVIGMSLRFDRIDNFWFVLRHELEHVIQGHGKIVPKIDIDIQPGESEDEDEKIANEAAAYYAISEQKMNSFIARKYPFFADIDIMGLANTIKVHPGIIAGKLQYHTKKYNLFRKHLVPIRPILTPSAVVDGWGDVYPLED